jgi:hypothetical protein
MKSWVSTLAEAEVNHHEVSESQLASCVETNLTKVALTEWLVVPTLNEYGLAEPTLAPSSTQ